MAMLGGFGVGLGFAGGLAAFVIVRLVGLISQLALLHRVGFALPNLRHYHPTWWLVPIALGGALVVIALARWSPVIRGHGIPESLEAITLRESRIAPRAAVAKPLSAAIAMGTGGPFGAEGPVIVTGGAIGSLLGQLVPVSPAERRILLACGAAAGMAGVFATPVAAILLAFELLVFERSLRALLPLLLATGIATEMHIILIGPHPLFAVTETLRTSTAELPLFVVVGVAAGILAVVFDRGLFTCEAVFRRLPIPERAHPLVGALGFALIGMAVPGTLSVGYWAITDSVNGRFVLAVAAVLFVGKLSSWWIALASNTSGGTLAPMFLVGATMGEMIGIGFARLFPGLHVQPGAFAIVAMGAAFGVGARALLTGGVFALEVTGAYHLVVPMLIAVGVAELVGEQFLSERIMSDKLARRGYRVNFDTEADPFRTRVAGQVMAPLPGSGVDDGAPTIDRRAYVRDALGSLLSGDAGCVVVTEEGAAVGVLTPAIVVGLLSDRMRENDVQPPSLHIRRHRRRPRGEAELTTSVAPEVIPADDTAPDAVPVDVAVPDDTAPDVTAPGKESQSEEEPG